jgi:Tol biopolymer transport system component
MTFGLRPIAVTGLCLLVAVLASVVAYRGLWPYPPRTAAPILAGFTLVVAAAGLLAARPATRRARQGTFTAALACAAIMPFVATNAVPGIAQPASYPIPGSPAYVVSAAPDGTWDLYLLPHGDAADLIPLTETDLEAERYPQLSPDGTEIAYTLVHTDGSTDIYLMRLATDGHPLSNDLLPPGDERQIAPSAWTPDGDLLVQVAHEDPPSNVELLDIGTGELTSFLSSAGNIAYSPDGNQIAFSRPNDFGVPHWDIWVADADGANARDVIDMPGDQISPAWSPDGTTLTFTGWLGDQRDVFVAGLDGEDITDLTAISRDTEISIAWTPHGQILFPSDRSHTGGTFLYFMNPDGSDVRLALRI